MRFFGKAHVGLVTAITCIFVAIPCLAAEGGGLDRHSWDTIMRVINFGILAFVIYKYGKDPLVKFLASKRASVALSLEELQKERELLLQQQEEQNVLIAQIDEKIDGIIQYYHRLGHDEKEKILARAILQRDHMLEDARQRADREFEQAKTMFRAEVVELAMQLQSRKFAA
jgi:F-type H+-transporting ATPase subunit b